MKVIVILAAFVAAPASVYAQCTEFLLSDLQMVQRLEPDQKENKILDLGFDLRSEFLSRGASVRGFSKCWNGTTPQQTVFEQLIWWNKTSNSITWFTQNERHYTALRRSIVERHGGSKVTENPDFYVGQQFQYRFGGQRVDGVEYFFVSISTR